MSVEPINVRKDHSEISVVVPFYNRADCFERLFQSVCSQTLLPDVVYIVDNGSSFEEVLLCKKMVDAKGVQPFQVVLVSSPNTGNANYARNLGTQLAETRYVAYLDSDDWWEPNHLDISKRILISSSKAGVYSGAIIHAAKVVVNYSADVNKMGNPFQLFYSARNNMAQTSSFVVDKNKISIEPWDNQLKRHQDYDFFLSVFYSGGWAYNNVPGVNFDRTNAIGGRSFHFKSMIRFTQKWKAIIRSMELKRYLQSQIEICRITNANVRYLMYYKAAYFSQFGRSFYAIYITSPCHYLLKKMAKKLLMR